MKFKAGDFVKFRHKNGSTGRVEELNHYGGYYIRWIYGRDVNGDVMSSSISSCTEEQLTPCSEDEYNKVRDQKGFGDS